MWSPGTSMVNSAEDCAARPLAKATAPMPPLEVREALLEGGNGGIHDAGVRVAVLLEVEVCGCRFGILEDVARRLVDRDGAGSGGRFRARPRVDGPGVKAELPVGQVIVGHVCSVSPEAAAVNPGRVADNISGPMRSAEWPAR